MPADKGKDVVTVSKPPFITDMENDYNAKVAHVFILHGNVDDFSDNSGNRRLMEGALASQFDSFMKVKAPGGAEDPDDEDIRNGFNVAGSTSPGGPRIMAKFTFSQGLEFFHTDSRKTFISFLETYYPQEVITNSWREDWQTPMTMEGLMFVLNRWFEASKDVVYSNRLKKARKQATIPEIRFTIMFPDADIIFPSGTINLADRVPIVNLRQWGRDSKIGDRNRILLITKSISDIHSSLTNGAVGITSHLVRKPSMEDRETWLTNFADNIKRKTATQPGKVGNNLVTQVNLAEGFSFRDFAIQSAGMSRRQMDDVIMHSWLTQEPVDFAMVRSRKQRALAEEYSSILDFFEPEHGFELVGGHENLKEYFIHNVIEPLRRGDRKLCSKGVLMAGPPGCQPAGSKVLMADGSWQNVEHVKVGDLVMSPQEDGSNIPAKVTETVVYKNRPVYEIATKGRSKKRYKCADNHIVPYIALERPRTLVPDPDRPGKNLSIRRKRISVLHEKQVRHFLDKGANYRKKARIFTTTAFDLPEREFSIHPYVLGALLGDGGLTGQPNITNADQRIFRKLESLGVTYGAYEAPSGLSVTKSIVGDIASKIRNLPVYGKTSHHKFVPVEYKTGSLIQRLELLAGLIDTDGSSESYTSCSEQLAKDFVDLVHSVGGFAAYRPQTTYDQNGTECLSFRAHYAFSEHLPPLVSGHKNQGPRNMKWKNPRNRNFEASYVGIEDVFGFVLDSPSEWYVTDDWLVTHNTAKTWMAKAVAKEAKMNFMIAKLDKVFGGFVGDTERNTRSLLDAIDAASPVIVFIDELDSILSSGRQSMGDSGTSGRVFNGIMTWLSDESRAGRVVAVSASNRPDLLDAALIRSGRFDAILPALPPQKGDAIGRGKILEALCRKFNVKFAKEVALTESSTSKGLGLMLHDKDRIWTGAEMEVVLKKALQISSRRQEKSITTETWTNAYNFVIPNTQEVERMTLLALLYTNDLEYCPVQFREEANNKKELLERLKALGWEEEN